MVTEWSGINALLYYGPTLIREIGLKGDTVSLVVSGGIGIVQFIAVLPAIAYIDSVGRKALLRGQYTCLHLPFSSDVGYYPHYCPSGRGLHLICPDHDFSYSSVLGDAYRLLGAGADVNLFLFHRWWDRTGLFAVGDCVARHVFWT